MTHRRSFASFDSLERRQLFAASPASLRAWAGATTLVDSLGRTFVPAASAPGGGFAGGRDVRTAIDAAITGTADALIFRAMRAGTNFSFAANVANGDYVAFIEFAEPTAGAAVGTRVFDVTAEGRTFASGVDAIAIGNANAVAGMSPSAVAVAGKVTIADGQANFAFVGRAGGEAIVSAITLVPTTPEAAALPYDSSNLPGLSRQPYSANNLVRIGQGLLLYSNENRGKYPKDFAVGVASGNVPYDALVSPRSATRLPRGPVTTAEQIAFARSVDDYVYTGLAKNNAASASIVAAYENPARVSGDLLALYADGHVALVPRATLAAQFGFDAAAAPSPAPPTPLGLPRDPAVIQSQANLAKLSTALQYYANEHKNLYPADLGELAYYVKDASVFVDPRLGHVAPAESTSWTLDQLAAWVRANGDYLYASTAQAKYSVFGDYDPVIYENPTYLGGALGDGLLLIVTGNGKTQFQETRWAYETLRINGPTVPATSSISGSVFDDADGDGVRAIYTEAQKASWVVYVDADDDGVRDPTELFAVASGVGAFRLKNVPLGNHVVRAESLGRWRATTRAVVSLTAAAPNATALSLGVVELGTATLTGVAYDDDNGSRARDAGEGGASYASVYVDLDRDGVLDANEPTATPDAVTGAFTLVVPDVAGSATYDVRTTGPTGTSQTTPTFAAALSAAVARNASANVGTFGVRRTGPFATMVYNSPVVEGGTVTFRGGSSIPTPGATITLYEWDLDFNGTFVADLKGEIVSTPAGDGNAMRAIALRITDSLGRQKIVQSAFNVTNVAPTANFAAAAQPAGSPSAFSFSAAADSVAADVAAGFKYSFDFNGDGDFADAGEVSNSTSPNATYTFTAPAVSTVRGRISDKDGGSRDYFATFIVAAPPPPPTTGQLTGTVFGTAGSYSNLGNTIAKAFDGSLATIVDLQSGNGGVMGLDFGSAKSVKQIAYAPRGGFASRMVGGVFQGSNTSDFAAAATLFTIAAKPVDGVLTTVNSINTSGFRYVRYVAPAGSYGNVAELRFIGGGTTTPAPTPTPAKLGGLVIGTAGSFSNLGNTIAKVFDGSTSTFFDAAAANGAWAGLDLLAPKTISSVQFAPRAGWANRMIGGRFEASNVADFSSGVVTLGTITTAPVAGGLTTMTFAAAGTFRYVRYLSPSGSYGNVAELAFYGS